MGGYVIAVQTQFRAATPISNAAADANFPLANLSLYTRPWRMAQSGSNVASGTTYFGGDLGAAATVAAVAIDNINVGSIYIEAASDAAFSTALVSVGPITVGENPLEGLPHVPAIGRRKHLLLTTGTALDGVSRRYWRVLANASVRIPAWDSASDAGTAGKMAVGSLLLLSSYYTWASGTSSYGELPLEATLVNDQFVGGGADPIIVGNPYAGITLSAAPASRSAMRTDLLVMLRQGLGRFFLFSKNAESGAEWYIARRAADVTVNQTAPNLITFDNLALQTAV